MGCLSALIYVELVGLANERAFREQAVIVEGGLDGIDDFRITCPENLNGVLLLA